VLIVEDGSVVPGANTFAGVQEAAAFHAERGGLIPVQEVVSAAVTFAAGGVLTAAAETFSAIPVNSIIEVTGAGENANIGFGHVRAVAGDELELAWLDTVDEPPGAPVTITIFEQSGWWHASPRRLEASLINGATYQRHRYPWAGALVSASQALPWPRRYVWVNPGADPREEALPGDVGAYQVADNVVPGGVIRCQLWLSLADIEAPLLASVDPQSFLKSKTISASGIAKVFEGKVRLRRFPHADAEVLPYLVTEMAGAATGPFRAIDRV
jgi:hypothetical protein